MTVLATGLFMFSMFALSEATPVSATSPLDNLALYADTSLSDNGWGGGWNKADVTDGIRNYASDWARGLALRYGDWHQVTIDFGQEITFDSVLQWYHGGMNNNEAAAYKLQYLRGTEWVDILDTSSTHDDLKYPDAATSDWWYYWSTPYENTFAPVVSSQLRIWNYPLTGSHTWLWEIEVYNSTGNHSPVPEPASMILFGVGLIGLAGFRRTLRKSRGK